MARVVDIKINSQFSDVGTSAANANVKKLQGTVRIALKEMGGMFGGVSRIADKFFTGGIWQAGAQSLGLVLDGLSVAFKKLFTNSYEESKRAAKKIAELNDQYSALARSVDEAYAKSDAQARRIAQINKETVAVVALREAEAELTRQRRIAAGEDAASVDAEMNAATASRSRDERARSAQSTVKQLEERRNGGWNALRNAERAVASAERTLPYAQSALQKYMRERWNDDHKRLIRSRASDEEVKQYMDEEYGDDETYKQLREGVAKAEANIADAKKRQVEAQTKFNDLTSEYVAALTRARAVAAQNAAEEVKAANEKAAADRKAAEERKEAEEKAAEQAAADEAERHDAEHKALLEQIEAEQKRERDAEVERHKKRIENIKDETSRRIAAIDKEIAKARELAAKWEEAARPARNQSFERWDAGSRRAERDQRRERERQARQVRRAQDELARLDAQGGRIAPQNAARAARLRKFIQDQDPNNNPALKQQQALEARREKLMQDQKKTIDNILAALKEGGL